MLPPALVQVVEQYHRALQAYVAGDADPVMRLFSRRDDVTLANPLGPPARGWNQVEEALDRAASQLHGGEPIRSERISEVVTEDLAYTLEIERTGIKAGGSDKIAPVSLRVTTIFRREDGEWRIVHRHADPITSPQSIESLFQQQAE